MNRGFFLRKWQAEWATSDTGSHYRALEPTVSLARKFGDPNRRKEVATAASTTSFISGADTLPETATGVRHFLLECPAQVGLQDDLARKCARNNWPFDLRTTLCQPSCLDIVYKWLVVSGRRL